MSRVTICFDRNVRTQLRDDVIDYHYIVRHIDRTNYLRGANSDHMVRGIIRNVSFAQLHYIEIRTEWYLVYTIINRCLSIT